MSENNHPQSDPNLRLDELLEPYFAKYHRQKCYPGLIFQQGKRKMVQINIPADDLPTLLQAKPSTDNDPDSGKNRPEVKGHAEEIKQYIFERTGKDKPWILGTLTANIAPDKIEIIELGRGICLVVIPRGVKLDITDGQHRKRAIHELIESANECELIADNDFPITLVLEGDFNQCKIDFRDMAQTRALDKSLLLSFGEVEGRVGITKNLVERVLMFQGKTEKIKGSPSKKTLIYTTNYIARAVSCALANDPSNELENKDVEKSSEALASCFNLFFSECSHTQHISETSPDKLTPAEVQQFKEYCVLGRSVGLEILGRLLYEMYDKDSGNCIFDSEKVLHISLLDWSRESNLWKGNIILPNYNKRDTTKQYKIVTNASAIRMAVSNAKDHLGWT